MRGLEIGDEFIMHGMSLLRNTNSESFSISIVAPMYNEEENLDAFFSRVTGVVSGLTGRYEIVCVNDGSNDGTLGRLVNYHRINPCIKIVNLSRNFGKEMALSAGLEYATGDVVIPIDSDLQDPPEIISQMVDKWKEGFDVVYATRRVRNGESFFKKFTAHMFYKVINAISEIPIPHNTGDYRLLDSRVVAALKSLPESGRFMKGLFSWVGFKQTSVLYDREPRFKGRTKWNYWKLWNFALDGLTSFSHLPIRIWFYVGMFLSSIALMYAAFLVLLVLIKGREVPGYASLMVVMLFLGGINMIGLGFLGEYMGRIFSEVKRRPLYLVSDLWGFDGGHPAKDSEAAGRFEKQGRGAL